MRPRLLASLAVVASVLSSASLPASGQSALPRTPWGDPDLQGVWEYWTFTPLQRPESLADKDVLTDEEAAAVAQRGVEAAPSRPMPISL